MLQRCEKKGKVAHCCSETHFDILRYTIKNVQRNRNDNLETRVYALLGLNS